MDVHKLNFFKQCSIFPKAEGEIGKNFDKLPLLSYRNTLSVIVTVLTSKQMNYMYLLFSKDAADLCQALTSLGTSCTLSALFVCELPRELFDDIYIEKCVSDAYLNSVKFFQ